jgi:hypothetical protein
LHFFPPTCPPVYYRAIVHDLLSTSLRASLPNLRPFQPIWPAADSLPAPVGTAAGDTAGRLQPAAQHVEVFGKTVETACGSGGGGGGGGIDGVSLGTPGPNAHIVFDVYKPGSFVSRYKGQFPAVQTHVAISSATPPTLGEMRAADAAAAAAVPPATFGEEGRPANVTWVAVLNGDIALYSIERANMLCLM